MAGALRIEMLGKHDRRGKRFIKTAHQRGKRAHAARRRPNQYQILAMIGFGEIRHENNESFIRGCYKNPARTSLPRGISLLNRHRLAAQGRLYHLFLHSATIAGSLSASL